MSYNPETELPSVHKPLTKEFQEIRKFNEGYKLKAKEYTDKTNNRRESRLKEGDVVLRKNLKPGKADHVYMSEPFRVMHRNGNQVEVQAVD